MMLGYDVECRLSFRLFRVYTLALRIRKIDVIWDLSELNVLERNEDE